MRHHPGLQPSWYWEFPPSIRETTRRAQNFPEHLLQINKPLYGLSETGLTRFSIYQQFYVQKLSKQSTAHDMCLLYNSGLLKNGDGTRKITILQTQDTLTFSNSAFDTLKGMKSEKFELKTKNTVVEDKSFLFKTNHSDISLDATNRHQRLAPISVSPVVRDEYVAQKPKEAYIASVCQPDCSLLFSWAARQTNPCKRDVQELNLAENRCENS